MSKYEYILLDWDGNLAKTLDIWLEACRIPIERRGVVLSDEEIASSFGAFAKHIKNWGFDDVEVIIEEADIIAKQKLPNVELYPDALEVLEGLHAKGIKLALITTSPHENVRHLLDGYDLTRFFQVIVAGDDTQNHKPHPEPLELAIEQMNGTKELCVMIGDSDKDLGAAKNAGIDSILFYPPEHSKFYDLSKLKAHKPTHIVSDFRKILEIV
jgi:pyrophosphatase PpaX